MGSERTSRLTSLLVVNEVVDLLVIICYRRVIVVRRALNGGTYRIIHEHEGRETQRQKSPEAVSKPSHHFSIAQRVVLPIYLQPSAEEGLGMTWDHVRAKTHQTRERDCQVCE